MNISRVLFECSNLFLFILDLLRVWYLAEMNGSSCLLLWKPYAKESVTPEDKKIKWFGNFTAWFPI